MRHTKKPYISSVPYSVCCCLTLEAATILDSPPPNKSLEWGLDDDLLLQVEQRSNYFPWTRGENRAERQHFNWGNLGQSCYTLGDLSRAVTLSLENPLLLGHSCCTLGDLSRAITL